MFFFFLSLPLSSPAQQFGCRWIHCPRPHQSQGVWFRRTFTCDGKPREARLFVATGGMVDILVNSRNVSTDSPVVNRGGLISADYDITDYLRPDSNTITIEYFPADTICTDKELSATFYGIEADGRPFACTTDDTWLSRPSSRSLSSDFTEALDATAYPFIWHSASREDYPCALWVAASCAANASPKHVDDGSPALTVATTTPDSYSHPQLSRSQRYFDTTGDTTFYEFGTAFVGHLRLTMREARPGQLLLFGGNRYVCNGTMDEQAFTKFIPRVYRRVMVCGDKNFKREQIQKMEGIELIGRHAEPSYPTTLWTPDWKWH